MAGYSAFVGPRPIKKISIIDYSYLHSHNRIFQAFKTAYDKFDNDPTLRRLAAEAKLSSRFNPVLTLGRAAQEERASEADKSALDSMYQIYKASKDELANDRADFEVYQPRCETASAFHKKPFVRVIERRDRYADELKVGFYYF